MTYGQEAAISALEAAAANLRTEIMRHVVDPEAQRGALSELGKLLSASIAGTVRKEKAPARPFG